MISPCALALWLAAGQIPLATETELPTGEKVMLAADQLIYEAARETLIARGNTTLRTEQLLVRADEVVYDQANQRADAKGNVMFVSGLLAAVADAVHVDMRTLEAHVEGGLFLRKRNVTPEQLLEARTPHELKTLGETVLTITGSRIKKIGPNEFLVDDLAFTPCDCDPTEPSWRVEARSANVELGERAILTFPTVYVYQVPIFWLPWLYVPLSDRRTGLLVPRPSFSGLNGVSLEQPVFVTLGESYDMTFTPAYYGGGRDPNFGIQGPRLHTEFRYAPSERTSGRAALGLLYDLRKLRDPILPGFRLDEPRGLRGELSWNHVQDMGSGWRNRVDAGFVSDGYYLRDVVADVLARQAEYLRSTAVISRSDERSWLGADVVLRQQIWAESQQLGFQVLRPDRRSNGARVEPLRTFARLPALTWAVPERPLAGPVWAGLTAQYARTAPVNATWGDEGEDGLYRAAQVPCTALPPDWPAGWAPPPCTPEPSQGNGVFEDGEREARDRLDLNPRVSLPIGLGRFARVTPYAAWRETVYLGEATGRLSHRGYLLGGAAASTTLVRDFANARHTVTPWLEVRAVPFVLGGVPVSGGREARYDEVDRAIQGGGFLQGIAELRQDLFTRRDGGLQELLRLDVGQGWDLASGARAETYVRGSARYGWMSLSGLARFDAPKKALTQLSATFSVDNGGGTALWASYEHLLDVGSDPLRAGVDELFGRALATTARTPEECAALAAAGVQVAVGCAAQQLNGGLRVLLPFGLGARYEAVIQPGNPTNQLVQQLVGLSYGPGCDCWRLEVHAWLRPAPPESEFIKGSRLATPDVGATLSIHQLGAFGG